MSIKLLIISFFWLSVTLFAIECKAQHLENTEFWIFEDTLKNKSFTQIQSDSIAFKRLSNTSIVYNITNSAIWVKFNISNSKLGQNSQFLELSAPTIHYVDFYSPDDASNYRLRSTGFLRGYNSRGILSDHFIFPIKPDSNWYYLRLESGHFLNTDIRISTLDKISSDTSRRHLVYGSYAGILLVIVLIVVAVVAQGKQYHFLFYVSFILFGSTITLLESGIYFESLWPNKPIFNYLFPIYTFGVSISILFFLRYAFKANQLASSLYYFNFWFLTIMPLFPVVYFLYTNHYSLALLVVQVSSMLIAFLVLLMTFICFVKSKVFKPYYRLIIIGQFLMVSSIAIYLAAQNQWIDLGFFRDFTIMVGGICEAVCFTIAIFTYQNSLIKKYHTLLKKQNATLQTEVDLRTRELEFINRDLLNAMQEKDNLLNIVVHDLRSPLNQTKALGSLLLRHNNDESEKREMLTRIEEASNHGIKLIDELSTISKLENQNDHVVMSQVSLSELCLPLLKNFELIASLKHIQLDVKISLTATIFTYQPHFIRILENLLSNAIKFSPAHSVVCFTAADHVISVKDHGPGFSEEDLKNAFGKFKKLSARPTAGESSTGLGLYIVKLLADKLKLTVEIQSKVGEGSIIMLKF